MSNHTAIKTAAGIGLMAASLGSSAGLHTFGEAMSYYKVSGSTTSYVHFLPSGPTATDQVILLDLIQSGTVSTWAYAMGGAIGANAAAGTGASTGLLSSPAGGFALKASGTVTYVKLAGDTSSSASSTFYAGDTQALSLSFVQSVTVSSQACNLSFSAQLDTDDYLQFTNVAVLPGNWPSATGDVYYKTISTGGTTAGTDSMASNVFNAYNASATSSFYTYSAWLIPVDGNAVNYVAVSALSVPFNKCVSAYTTRTMNNGTGGVLGGHAGMMRLW